MINTTDCDVTRKTDCLSRRESSSGKPSESESGRPRTGLRKSHVEFGKVLASLRRDDAFGVDLRFEEALQG